MTTSVWDKAEINKQFSECETLAEIIRRLEQDFAARGEVICEIRVDGQILSEEEEKSLGQNRRDGISTLAIASEHPESLIREALASALDYLPKVRDAGVKTADRFRGPDMYQAQLAFAEAVEGCQWLVDTIHSIRGAADGIGVPLRSRDGWLTAESALMRSVNEMVDAYQKQDFVLVADVLEYELHNALEQWRDVLRGELEQHMTRSRSPEASLGAE